jgi:branched-subunit amino acid transport protein
MIDRVDFWLVVVVLGIGTYLLRFSFLGFLGNRLLPWWLVRSLRYTAVAVLPALVAPAVLWPEATGGQTDPARLLAACATVLVGAITRQMMAAIAAGAAVLFAVQYLA